MNKAAQALGRLNKGKPKRISAAESERRRQSLALARAKRWPQKGYRIEDDRTGKVVSRHETFAEAGAALDKLIHGKKAGSWTVWDATDEPCDGGSLTIEKGPQKEGK